MANKQLQYEKMPEHYLLCFNDDCDLADSCLHYGNMVRWSSDIPLNKFMRKNGNSDLFISRYKLMCQVNNIETIRTEKSTL